MTFCASPIDRRFFIWCSFLLNNSFCAVTFFSNVRFYRLEWCLQPRYSLHAVLLFIEPSHRLLQYEFFRCYGWTICIFIQEHKAVNFALNLDLMRKGRGQSWWPLQPGIRQLPIFGSSTALVLLIWPINYLVERGETWINFLSFVFSIVEINDQWKRKTKEFPEKRWISCPFKTHLHPRGGFLFLHWSKFLFTLSSSHLLAYMSAHMQCIAPTPSYEGNNYVRSNLTCSTVDQECQQQTQHTTNTAWNPRIIVF